MDHRSAQLAGLGLFSTSGLIFLRAAAQAGDALATVDSIVWLVGCTAWLLPFVRPCDDH